MSFTNYFEYCHSCHPWASGFFWFFFVIGVVLPFILLISGISGSPAFGFLIPMIIIISFTVHQYYNRALSGKCNEFTFKYKINGEEKFDTRTKPDIIRKNY